MRKFKCFLKSGSEVQIIKNESKITRGSDRNQVLLTSAYEGEIFVHEFDGLS